MKPACALKAMLLQIAEKDVRRLAMHSRSGKSPLYEIHFEAFQNTQRVLQIQTVTEDALQTKTLEYFHSEGH